MKAFLLIALLTSLPAFAVGVDDEPQANYKNPKDEVGLCTPRNEEEWPARRGWCKAMNEQLNDPGCASDAVKDICQRIANNADPKVTDPKKKFKLGDHIDCVTKDGKSLQDFAKDPKECAYILKQYFAIIAIETSDWNPVKNKDQGTDEGIFGLKKEDMADSRYSCGCNTAVHKEIPPDRPAEGHQNVVCGMYMALYWAQKDGTFSNSEKVRPGQPTVPANPPPGAQSNANGNDDGPKGFSRIFKVMQGYDSNDKVAVERNKRMTSKMKHFCDNYKPGSFKEADTKNQKEQETDTFQDSMNKLQQNSGVR